MKGLHFILLANDSMSSLLLLPPSLRHTGLWPGSLGYVSTSAISLLLSSLTWSFVRSGLTQNKWMGSCTQCWRQITYWTEHQTIYPLLAFFSLICLCTECPPLSCLFFLPFSLFFFSSLLSVYALSVFLCLTPPPC